MKASESLRQETENSGPESSSLFRLQPLDHHLAALFQRMDPEMPAVLHLAVRILSARTREGHVCLDLAGRDGFWPRVSRMVDLEGGLDAWRRDIVASSLVGERPEDLRPLMLMGNRLYLRRYFRAEAKVAEGLLKRAGETFCIQDTAALKKVLDFYFPEQEDGNINMQKAAAFAAAGKPLSVIVGGPGTGKTTTVCRLLASLCTLAETLPQVVLAAPTGKAAGRLGESMMAGKAALGATESRVFDAIPEFASTLHRLLGLAHGRKPRHHKDNPLPADIVVVDEVSMVDLFLMSKLMDALKPGARLILLGDRFQLASVMPGSVLGEICKGASSEKSEDFIRYFEEIFGKQKVFSARSGLSPMADCVVALSRSWRFDSAGGIGRLARSLNEGQGADVAAMLEQGEENHVLWSPVMAAPDLAHKLRDFILGGFSKLMEALTPEDAFAVLDCFRILCVLKEGPFGVGGINGLVESILEKEGLLRLSGPWYRGRPVIVLRNDPASGLYNGDVGVTLEDGQSGEMAVYFPSEDGGYRSFHPLRLPEVETVFAMTVHKSQGSESDRVLLVLPDRDVQVMTREILYTAVTRARKEVILAGRMEILMQGTERRVRRSSGLGDVLWK
ncbi:DNA helicase/exodeoxyribonuclease V alpha subunit [Desulfobotulus alkaliphilus]|uniref:DNA helicase/exodeoxyribonuclease V alpha subunit n=1 Tax=Desulfobotulus alkaliphilus TaxID=622671 RepID=A0A562RVT8_9BACT|nr:exodeoxyribonuclease V subunit alpha [Desulfobotulus alkaliphilus]TWI73078.1 DNA helicase/exodeoxyribonuclease V alpha subunit [Desulfobotulus alkaliphilus]